MWVTGTKQTPEHKAKISVAMKGKRNAAGSIRTEDFKNNLRSHTGKKRYNYKGKNVSYRGLHAWVKRHKGTPTECSKCGAVKKIIDWANVDGLYKRKLEDFIALCRPCHRKHDKK